MLRITKTIKERKQKMNSNNNYIYIKEIREKARYEGMARRSEM